MSPGGTAELVEQARTLEHPQPVLGFPGQWGISFGGQSRQVTQAQLEQLRAGFVREMRRGLRAADATVAGGRYGHEYMIEIHNDQRVVSWISDRLGGVTMPSLSIWEPPAHAVTRAQADLNAGQLATAVGDTAEAQTLAQTAMRLFIEYREGTITGAGRSVTTLEWTRDIAFAVDGVLATVVTGGAASGVLLGTAISTTGTIAQQGMEVHLGMRRAVDWSGIAIDAALNVILSLLAGRLAARLQTSGATAWMARRLGSAALQRIIQNLVMGRAQGLVHTTLRALIDNARGARPMTAEELAEQLVHQLTTTDNVFHDIVIGEISHRYGEHVAEQQQSQQRRQLDQRRQDQEHQEQQRQEQQRQEQQRQEQQRQEQQRQEQQQQQAPPPGQEQQQQQQQAPPPGQEQQQQQQAPPPGQEQQQQQQQAPPPGQEQQQQQQQAPTPGQEQQHEQQQAPAPGQEQQQQQLQPPAPPAQQEQQPPPAPPANEQPAQQGQRRAPRPSLTDPEIPGIELGDARRRGLELIRQLPEAQRQRLMDRLRALPPDQAGRYLTQLGNVETPENIASGMEERSQRAAGRPERPTRDEAVREHLEDVAPQVAEEPGGRVRRAGDPTEVPAEPEDQLGGLRVGQEPAPPPRISAEEAGQDRSQLRQNLRGSLPEWVKDDGDWNAHHVIPWELRNHEVFEVLRNRTRWDHNEPENGIVLPTRPGLATEGEPVHQVNRDVIRNAPNRPANVPEPDPQTMRDLQGHPILNQEARERLDAMAKERLPDGTRLVDHPDLLLGRVRALQDYLRGRFRDVQF